MEVAKLNRLIIIGASGHGKVVAYIACLIGYKDIVFLDNDSEKKECAGYPVLGPDNMTEKMEGDTFVAIGNHMFRKKLMERDYKRAFPVLIHPSAVIANDVIIGAGSVVMAGTVINSGTKIGRGVIINTSSSVDHDCIIDNYSHISVGAHLCGSVQVGENTWIGAGSTISNNINITSNVMIGSGTVVVHSIEEKGTYIGVPARKMVNRIQNFGGGYPLAHSKTMNYASFSCYERKVA